MPTVLGPKSDLKQDQYGSEFWEGRAHTLSSMRLMRHYIPESAALLEGFVPCSISRPMGTGPEMSHLLAMTIHS
ncbi:uncharacterized protein TrAtP1_008943 [Trichoderma atroviride]|uniref:uncharacterized protein n=1 Tax=Hypocrea atroviridis TaxID=63577 RepID=UPI0033211410|nr:hypothetical protein TrAtP1_008943 [Trichoderma atroviride]